MEENVFVMPEREVLPFLPLLVTAEEEEDYWECL